MEGSGTPPHVSRSAQANDRDVRAADTAMLAERLESARSELTREAAGGMSASLRAKFGASDIVQDAMLDASRRLDQYRGQSEAEWRGWLLAILHNRLRMARRRFLVAGKRRVGLEVPMNQPTDSNGIGLPNEPIDRSASPGEKAARRELEARLMEALHRLSEEDRRLVRWRHEEQQTFEQIADRLGISSDAVRKRWGRALIRLREALGEIEP